MYKLLLFFSVLLFINSGCASLQQNSWLSSHRLNLKRLADSNLAPEQKVDGMIEDYVQFMKEDLKFVNPVKGIKFVTKYHNQNEASLDKILQSAEQWQGKLLFADKVGLGLRIVQKPYLKDLIDLAPKFKRKYKEYSVALKLLSKVSGGLTKLAGKELGF